jgi:hypothetical protein
MKGMSLQAINRLGREAVEQIFTVYLSLYWKFFLGFHGYHPNIKCKFRKKSNEQNV